MSFPVVGNLFFASILLLLSNAIALPCHAQATFPVGHAATDTEPTTGLHDSICAMQMDEQDIDSDDVLAEQFTLMWEKCERRKGEVK